MYLYLIIYFFLEKKHDYEVIHTIIGYLFGTAASYSFTIIAKFTIGSMYTVVDLKKNIPYPRKWNATLD